MKKRILSIFMTLCMILTLLPTMAAAATTPNLIANPGGETADNNYGMLKSNSWNEDSSPERGYSYEAAGMAVTEYGGSRVMGFFCTGNPSAIASSCYQTFDVTSYTADSNVSYTFSGLMTVSAQGTGSGTATLKIEQLDTNGNVVSSDSKTASQPGDALMSYTMTGSVVSGATQLRISIAADLRVPDDGSDAFAAFDDLSLTLTTTPPLTITGGTEGTDYTYADSVLTVKTATALTIANASPGTPTANRIEVTSTNGANLTLAGVNIDASGTTGRAAFKIAPAAGAVDLTLADGSANTLKSGANCAGLQKDNTALLTIHGGTNGTGALHAVCGSGGAGIGANPNSTNGSSMTITGGTVITEGDVAGIGGGSDGASAFNVAITGGNVSGTVGGGSACAPIYITVSGGSVNAVRTGETPTNGSGTAVQLYTLTVRKADDSVLANTAVTALSTAPDLGYAYGLTNVKTDANGRLYVYLPAGKTAVSVTAGGKLYSGSAAGGAATLKPPPPTAEQYADGTADGTAAAAGTDYVPDAASKTLLIKTAKGAAWWDVSSGSYLGYTVKLDADIDVGGFLWTPAGNSTTPFTGTFDGQDHTISNLTVTTMNGSYAGVFGVVGSSGTVKDLTVSGSVSVSGSGELFAGGITGCNYGLIDRCASSAEIRLTTTGDSSKSIIGGIAGSNYNTIRNCRNSGAITAASSYLSFAGGIVGDTSGGIAGLSGGGSVTNCFSTGAVSVSGGSDTNYAGGIAGIAYNGAALTNCYSTGAVTAAGTGALAGGICGGKGSDSVPMTNCFWLSTAAAALIGTSPTADITDCDSFTGAGDAVDHDGDAATAEVSLLEALNSWVTARASADYLTWQTDASNVNSGYPVFGGIFSITPGITITAAGKSYDGSAIEPPVVAGNGGNGDVTWYSKLSTSTGDYTSGLPKDAGTWSVKASVAASGVYTAAESAAVDVTITKADQSAPAAGAGYTVNYAAETITVATGYEVSATDFGAAVSSGDTVTPGGTYYVRLPADDNHNAGGTTSFTLPARPATPNAPALSRKTDTAVTVEAVSGQEYSIDGGAGWNSTGSFTGLTANTNYSVLTRVKSTAAAFRSADSAALSVTTKTAPAGSVSAPVIGTGANHPTDTGITVSTFAGQEYVISTSADDPASWSGTGYFMATENGIHTFENLTPATKYFIHTRTAETDTAMPSGSAKTQQYTLPTAPAADAVTINYAAETVSFAGTLEVYTAQIGGSQISSGGSISNHISDAGSPARSVCVRVKAGSDGTPASEWTAVTIPARPAAPDAPALSGKTDTSITVTAVSGQEYSADDGASWNSDGTFAGLAANTNYSILTRVKATDSGFKSAGSPALSVTTKHAGSDLNAAMFTFTAPADNTLIYSKTAKAAAVVAAAGYTGKVGAIIVQYYKVENDTDVLLFGAPADAGTYRVRITVDDSGSAYMGATNLTDSGWTFTIAPKPVSLRWTSTIQTYSGSVLYPSAAANDVEAGDTVSVSVTGAKDAGTGSSAATITNPNYTITNPTCSFLIQKAPVTFTVTGSAVPYDGSGHTAAVTASPDAAYTVTYRSARGDTVTNPASAGSYDIYAVIDDTNYRHAGYADGTARKIGVLTIYQAAAPAAYAVSFDANGGTGTTAALPAAQAGTARVLPAGTFSNAAKSFAGWQYNGKTYQPGDSFSQPAADVTFKALWSDNVYSIGGMVNEDGSPAANAVVTLMLGSRQIAQTVTASDGSYGFPSVTPGTYNLVASKNGVTQTVLTVVTDRNVTGQDITMPAGRLNSVVEVKAGTPDIVVGDLEKAFTAADETAAQTQAVELKLTAEAKAADSSDPVQQEIGKKAGSAGLYLDLTLTKTVGGTPEALTSSPVLLTAVITLPAELQGRDSYTVYRYHGGEVQALTATANADGEKIEVNQEKTVLTVYTRNFSAYAVKGVSFGSGSASGSGSYPVSVDTAGLQNGTVTVSPASASAGTKIVVTVKPDAGYALGRLTVTDSSGREIAFTDNGGGTYSFTMPNGRASVSAAFAKSGSPFTDVSESAYYYDAVLWAVGNDVTAGTAAASFSPDGVCTRAQAVTFLWRAMGSPEPTGKTSPFTDVSAEAYYCRAVLWATEKGVTVGTGAAVFSPDETVTRAQAMTFLWRAAGKPAAGTANPFADVDTGAYYGNAVLWAVRSGITNGTAAAAFSPAQGCTRAQIVTFLYRHLGK